MNPNTVFSASLVTSLVLWYPSMQACLRGDLDLAPAGLRYLAALTASRLALGFLARLVNAYRATQDTPAPGDAPGMPADGTAADGKTAAEPADGDPAARQRRRDDRRSGDGETDSGILAA